MVFNITTLLNQLEMMGVFAYVIPFLLIFAIIFAILDKTKILGENKAIEAIIGIAVGLLALQFDIVSTFFADIFPKFGVGLALFLVLVIVLGFFTKKEDVNKNMKWIGYVIGAFVVIWALSSWNFWGIGNTTFFWQIQQYLGWIILAGLIIFVIIMVVKSPKTPTAGEVKPAS